MEAEEAEEDKVNKASAAAAAAAEAEAEAAAAGEPVMVTSCGGVTPPHARCVRVAFKTKDEVNTSGVMVTSCGGGSSSREDLNLRIPARNRRPGRQHRRLLLCLQLGVIGLQLGVVGLHPSELGLGLRVRGVQLVSLHVPKGYTIRGG